MSKKTKNTPEEKDLRLDLDDLDAVSGGLANPAYLPDEEPEEDDADHSQGLGIGVRKPRKKGGMPGRP
jgi:hypothetical protein